MSSELVQAVVDRAEALCFARFNTRELPEDIATPIAAARTADSMPAARAAGEALAAALSARGDMYHWAAELSAAMSDLAAATAEEEAAPSRAARASSVEEASPVVKDDAGEQAKEPPASPGNRGGTARR